MTDWKVLARNQNGIGVLRCPEGHIHLEIDSGVMNVRFSEEQFFTFALTMMQAARNIAKGGAALPFEMQPSNGFVRN